MPLAIEQLFERDTRFLMTSEAMPTYSMGTKEKFPLIIKKASNSDN